MHEAELTAAFVRAYWEPKREPSGKVLPPLGPAAALAGFGPEIADEPEQLALLATQLGSARGRRPTRQPRPTARALAVVRELWTVLDFGLDDASRATLDRVRKACGKSRSQQNLALALEGYARPAETARSSLAAIRPRLDPPITQARALAAELRGLRDSKAEALQSQQTTRLRNGLVTLALERVVRVRQVARFVFRDHPEVLRLVTSLCWLQSSSAAECLRKSTRTRPCDCSRHRADQHRGSRSTSLASGYRGARSRSTCTHDIRTLIVASRGRRS